MAAGKSSAMSAPWLGLRPQLLMPILTLLLLAPVQVVAMKQSWSFESEDREQFLIERFGFGRTGHMDVRVSDVAFSATGIPLDENARKQVHAGLLFIHVRRALCVLVPGRSRAGLTD